eukprot:SAG11_NODE_2252_length_3631_cov_2.469706_5_plen_111_part_01
MRGALSLRPPSPSTLAHHNAKHIVLDGVCMCAGNVAGTPPEPLPHGMDSEAWNQNPQPEVIEATGTPISSRSPLTGSALKAALRSGVPKFGTFLNSHRCACCLMCSHANNP